MSENEVDAASQRAAEQARLRKERREAKIRAGGSARLNRITGLGGGMQRDDVPVPPQESPAETPVVHADPEEVDISQHYYAPRQTPRTASPSQNPNTQDDLQRLMLSLQNQPTPQLTPGGTPLPQGQDDPLASLMTQLLPGGAPPGGAQMPGFPPQVPQQQPPSKASSVWRILHALFALSLGLYVALSTPFSGTLPEREASVEAALETPPNFFYIFASVEALLLTTRFFVDDARHGPSGIIGTVLGFLPPRTAGYIRVVMRYGQVFTTVRSDLLVCVFVLGVASLWRSVGGGLAGFGEVGNQG